MSLTLEMIGSQIMFWVITILAVLITWEFYRSVDGRLRILMIQLFLSKVWIYGFAGTFYLFWDFGYFRSVDQLWVRLICNVPMFIIMIKLWLYIKYKK